MVRQNAKLWYKVAQLHLRGLEDMENSVATLRNSLPLVPNQNTSKIMVHAQFAPPDGANPVNMHAYIDTHDHLLSLNMEKTLMNLQTSSLHMVPEAGVNITSAPKKSRGTTLTKAGSTRAPDPPKVVLQ
jgi:hypothetical protein